MGKHYCCVKECKNNSDNKDISFHSFPNDKLTLDAWVKVTTLFWVFHQITNFCIYRYQYRQSLHFLLFFGLKFLPFTRKTKLQNFAQYSGWALMRMCTFCPYFSQNNFQHVWAVVSLPYMGIRTPFSNS